MPQKVTDEVVLGRAPADTLSTSVRETPKDRRQDIQGLRAILMAQVLLFHAWGIGSPIGVDAFILVSAYLMTSSFIRRSESGRMPFFVERWGNTFKRILPPLVVTVLVTLGMSLLLLSSARWREITIQSFASITYWENWRLVEVSADYYADNHALSSPLQHLWSMSMQGQVFLLWPLLMTAAVLLARYRGTSIRRSVLGLFAFLMVLSLWWLLFLAPQDGSVYFDTRARMWEFAFGSMVAAAAPWLRVNNRIAKALVPLAFGVLMTFCLVSIGNYPGPMAFIPMLSVSVLLLYVPSVESSLVARGLRIGALVKLGNISYSVYLVHWPIFVFFLAYMGRERLGLRGGLILIAFSISVAWLLSRFVDEPVQRWAWADASTTHKWLTVLVSLIIGLVPIGVVFAWITYNTRAYDNMVGEVVLQEVDALSSSPFPGAAVLLGSGSVGYVENPIPDELNAVKHEYFSGDCPLDLDTTLGNRNGDGYFCLQHGDSATATFTAWVVGSSHAQQPLQIMVEDFVDTRGGTAVSILLGGCPWSSSYGSPGCRQHNQRVLEAVRSNPPDMIFLVYSITEADSNNEQILPGVEDMIREATSLGVTVVGVRDNLRSVDNLYECSSERPEDHHYGGCIFEEGSYFGSELDFQSLLGISGFHAIDLQDAYCIEGLCPTIIGNVFVYMDTNHVTTTYSRTMAPFFTQRVIEELGLKDKP